MDNEADYGPFLKALSGADPIQARRFAAAKALELDAFLFSIIQVLENPVI